MRNAAAVAAVGVWCVVCVLAQTASSRALGTISAIDASARQISLKTDSGSEIKVVLSESVKLMRVPPGQTDLKNAATINLSDIGVGDRVLARGVMAGDQTTLAASSVIVMTKADIARKHEGDRAEWQKRGVAGTIKALDPEKKEITIALRGRDTGKTMVITAAGNVGFRRYAPDSVRFDDARPSSFAELHVGDSLRALGNKNEDGTRLTAEEIVSGAFRNIAGTVITVDAAARTIRITDLDAKKPVLVRLNADSNLRRMPEMLASMMARRLQGGAEGGPRVAGERPAGAGAGGFPGGGGRAGGPGMGGPGGPPDIDQMLERMPALNLAELKPGEAIIVASTAGAEPDKVTAITLLAGVDPLLRAAPQGNQGMVLGNWNLDVGIPPQ